MAMIEQNMSGVRLERLRKKALRRMRIIKGIGLGIFVVPSLAYAIYGIKELFQEWPIPLDALIGLVVMTLGAVLISFLVSFLFYLIAVCIFGKPSEEFSRNYKNKYVLTKLREVPGFSCLRYDQNRSLSAQELCQDCLPPIRNLPQIRSMDYWEGSYDCVHFRAAQLDFYPYDSAIRLFDGQVMVFSRFDKYKISQSPVQVFARRKGREKPKGLTFPMEIQTEHEAFNQRFSVYAMDGQNAFYILTPRIIEDILSFSESVGAGVYLVFSGQRLYVGCDPFENPFEPREDRSVEEQSGTILLAAEMVRKARDILVHLEEDREKGSISTDIYS